LKYFVNKISDYPAEAGIHCIHALFPLYQGLVNCWRIDKVSVLLKCLHRNIEARGGGLSEAWREVWEQVVASVQAQMVASYGHPLQVTEEL
jgi:hypothetical protein